MSEQDRHALQRFVAGLDVDADALATAITARALDATIVDEALLRTLADPETVVRRRAARRIARMDSLAPEVAAVLRQLAATDPDADTRASAEAALASHAPPPAVAADPSRPRALALLRLAAIRSRAEDELYAFEPVLHDEAPYADALLRVEGGAVVLVLAGLPTPFTGTLPAVVAGGEVLARATFPVTAEGQVTIAFAPEAGTLAALWRRLERFEVVVDAA